MTESPELTVLLERWQDGEEEALDQLWPVVYHQLRECAAADKSSTQQVACVRLN